MVLCRLDRGDSLVEVGYSPCSPRSPPRRRRPPLEDGDAVVVVGSLSSVSLSDRRPPEVPASDKDSLMGELMGCWLSLVLLECLEELVTTEEIVVFLYLTVHSPVCEYLSASSENNKK